MAYQTGWIPIVDLELGSSVANKFDVSFGNIDNALTVLGNVETTANQNKTDIVALNSSVSDLDTRVTALENAGSMQYEFSKLSAPVTITDDTAFTRLVAATVDPQNQGVFEYKLSIRWSIDSTSSSAVFRYAIIRNDDASPTWYELWEEAKDTTNDMTTDIFFPIDEPGGDKVEFALEARVETSGVTLNVEFADIIIDQKR